MLTLSIETTEKAKNLVNILKPNDNGAFIFLLEDDNPIGVATIIFKDVAELIDFKILDGYDDLYNTQFFFRGILFKLGAGKLKLRIKTDNESIMQYGFKQDGDYMELDCEKAVYPSSCKHDN